MDWEAVRWVKLLHGRGIFRAQSNIFDGSFPKNNGVQLLIIFAKSSIVDVLIEFWIHRCIPFNLNLAREREGDWSFVGQSNASPNPWNIAATEVGSRTLLKSAPMSLQVNFGQKWIKCNINSNIFTLSKTDY